MLKHLELNGFKSFAKKSLLGFSSPITAVVGPNGSGKSNVAEAFRFVLGEQSMKSMRGKRGEDLIFSGSKDIPRMNRASVKVTFDNSRRIFDIDFDEVVLERVVHRDSQNNYFINGSQVRLKDIIEMLAKAHIGSSGHHIISQGEADRILSASFKERRAMIEDALGLKIYHYKRLESERKLEKTHENIKSVESLRREIAPHLRFLKKQVEKVEKARELKTSLVTFYREYLKREELYQKNEELEIESGMKGPLQELEMLERDLARTKALLEASTSKDRKSDEIIALEGEISRVRQEKNELLREIGRIEGEIAATEKLAARENEQRIGETVPFSEVEKLASEVSRLLDEAGSSGDISAIRKILSAIRNALHSLIERRKILTVNAKPDTLRDKEELEKAKREALQKLSSLKDREESLGYSSEALRKDIEKAKDSSRDAEREMFRIMARKNELSSALDKFRAREDALRHEQEDFKRELGEAAALTGREVIGYMEAVLADEDGAVLMNVRQMQAERRRTIEKMKIRLEETGGGSSEEILKEFREVEERDTFLSGELEDLTRSAESLRLLIDDLEATLDREFKDGIGKINAQFQQFFALMFGGGLAKLSVIKEIKRRPKISDSEEDIAPDQALEGLPEEDEEEGIDIEVHLPHKKIKGLMMLSGGERALTSIALLFAVSQVNPPPFIILDETDAALDEANSRKYGDMIENLSKYSQLILITHNRETMSRAGVLYGVTMGSQGHSKLLSIQFDEAVEVAK